MGAQLPPAAQALSSHPFGDVYGNLHSLVYRNVLSRLSIDIMPEPGPAGSAGGGAASEVLGAWEGVELLTTPMMQRGLWSLVPACRRLAER